uniref:RT_RNaseH domain-containing protein n=1 Tax=Strongyloides stercoralis TaxID=6248 RepID=A0A0K0EAY9_STRER
MPLFPICFRIPRILKWLRSSIANILYDATSSFTWTEKHTDASIQGIKAALIQNDKPIAFASRTLKKSEIMYPPVQLEALGVVYALKQFTPFIYGKRTTVLTDQHSFISLMTKKDVSNILD